MVTDVGQLKDGSFNQFTWNGCKMYAYQNGLTYKYFGTLRNVYNFFVLYANQDDTDPKNMEVPYADRPELDRWILSKYNKLVRDVNASRYSFRADSRAVTSLTAAQSSSLHSLETHAFVTA